MQDGNHQKKRSSSNLWSFLMICGEIQVQFVISTFKTEITKWCQIWCLDINCWKRTTVQWCNSNNLYQKKPNFVHCAMEHTKKLQQAYQYRIGSEGAHSSATIFSLWSIYVWSIGASTKRKPFVQCGFKLFMKSCFMHQ